MKCAAALISLLVVQLVGAPPPKLVREIGLKQIISGQPQFTSVSLTFSPDDNWIAIVAGYNPTPGKGHLPLLLSGPASIFLVPRTELLGQQIGDQRIQIDPGMYPAASAIWSPNSDSLLVQGVAGNQIGPNTGRIAKLWNLRGEELGHYGLQHGAGIFGFLDAEHLLTGDPPAKTVETMDLHGQVVDRWTAPKQWRVVDISPDRHLLAVLPDEEATKTLVVDYATKKILLSKDNPYHDLNRSGGGMQTSQYFTEGGKTLCLVGTAQLGDPQFDVAPECWDVDSGKRIAKFDGIRGGVPAAASPRGSRLMLTRYTTVPGLGRRSSLGLEYVVWDFRSGTQVAAWKPQQLSVISPVRLSGMAISSTGRYAAEIAGDVLRIYELP
jgi:hypothetical protein